MFVRYVLAADSDAHTRKKGGRTGTYIMVRVTAAVIKPLRGMANDKHAFNVRLHEPPETKGARRLCVAVSDHLTEGADRRPHSTVLVVNP